MRDASGGSARYGSRRGGIFEDILARRMTGSGIMEYVDISCECLFWE
jgi:hypothetical protein